MHRIQAPIEFSNITSRDGTRLRVYRCGTGPNLWLLPPGLGTPLLAWKEMFEHFHRQMTIVTWDPRGCFDSEAPDDPARLGVEYWVEDAEAVIHAMEWGNETFVTGGWSLAIQVGLELYDHMPERVRALALINGSYEHVLKTAFSIPFANHVLGGALSVISTAAPLFAPATQYLLGQKWAVEFLQSLGIVAENEAFFGEVVQEFRKLDFATYFKMIREVNKHSARHILPRVQAPTLITAGTGDKMTPLHISRAMHEQIPGSELFLIPTGTHYTTLEFPEIVNLKLEHFFRTRVFPDTWE